MEIKTLATGSTGNCYYVRFSNMKLLIEAGIPIRKIRQGLDYKLSDIDACLISHQHADHCAAVRDIAESGIPCYMLPMVKESLELSNTNINLFGNSELKNNWQWEPEQFGIEDIKIKVFPLLHYGAKGEICLNAGFLMQSGKEKLLYVTDTAFCSYTFTGLTHIMIEANHSKPLLAENIESGAVHGSMRERLLWSHFSLENVKKFLQVNDLSRCKEIHLIHLSRKNADADFFKSEIEKLTGVPVQVGPP